MLTENGEDNKTELENYCEIFKIQLVPVEEIELLKNELEERKDYGVLSANFKILHKYPRKMKIKIFKPLSVASSFNIIKYSDAVAQIYDDEKKQYFVSLDTWTSGDFISMVREIYITRQMNMLLDKNKKLMDENKKLTEENIELKYRPGGPGMEEAQLNFLRFAK